MVLFKRSILTSCFLGIVAVGFAQFATQSAQAAKPITKLQYDASAPKQDLFEGMDQGSLEVKMIPKDSLGGNLLIKNTSGETISTKIPEAFVGIQVLKQFDDLGGGLGGSTGAGGTGGQTTGGGGGTGSTGTGLDSGDGFFSIPPEKVVLVKYNSVCLEHGKREPSPRMTYRLARPEEFTQDARLVELLKVIGNGRINARVAQAAAWHLSNNMSWQELASKETNHLGGLPPTPYFSPAQIMSANQVVIQLAAIVRQQENKKEDEPAPTGTRVRQTRSSRVR